MARALGVCEATLQRWQGEASEEHLAGELVEVVVSGRADGASDTQPSPRGVTVVTASGHRVEGLSLAQAVELLAALP